MSSIERGLGEPSWGEQPHGVGAVGSGRERVLRAVAEVVAERGVAGASVGAVVARAGVSSRTFYKLFAGLDECLVAVMEGTLERVGVLAAQSLVRDGSWRDGMRSALAAVLAFFDSEPELARVCLVETLGGAPLVVEQRERIVAAFRALVVAHIEGEVSHVSPLAGEAVMASVMGIVRTHLVTREPQPLITLLGPLMGVIVAPFGVDEELVAEEVLRGEQLARAIQAAATSRRLPPVSVEGELSTRFPTMVGNPAARRARECVRFLAECPGSSNIEVAAGIGVTQKSQISTLLSNLRGNGLVVKHSAGPGKRNAWHLTRRGAEIARALPKQDD